MKSNLRSIIYEVLMEALWGSEFQVIITTPDGQRTKYSGMATRNAKPDELPFRITWMQTGEDAKHVDLTWEEISQILSSKHVPPEIVQRASKKWGEQFAGIEIRPFVSRITEGVDFSVSGVNYSDTIEDMISLSYYLQQKVLLPIMQKMTPEEKKNIDQDVIACGPSYEDKSGKLYIRPDMLPTRWRPRVVGGVRHFLLEAGVQFGKWHVQTTNNGEEVIMIPIEHIPEEHSAPSLHITATSANAILTILGITDIDDYFSHLDADDLLERIGEFWGSEKEKQVMQNPDGEKFIHFIKKLSDIALWAKKHGFSKISLS